MTPLIEPQTRSERWPGTTESVAAVRRWLAKELADLGVDGDTADRVLLVASELGANAVRHTWSGLPLGGYTVTLTLHPDRVGIEVTDDGGPGIPQPRALDGADAWLADSGRGLALVEAFASSWWTRPAGEGTVVGALIALPHT